MMLLEAVEQVQKRPPSPKDIRKSLSYLHPTRVLNQFGRVSLTSLPMIHLAGEKIDEIDNQYRSTLYVNWREGGIFEEGIPSDSVNFWSGVLTYRNGRFGDLATYALVCLTTPTSNAVVERMFSYVTGIKTKSRNKLSFCRPEAIVRIRTNIYFMGICCKDMKPTPRMFELCILNQF